jgi:hypothetical protein
MRVARQRLGAPAQARLVALKDLGEIATPELFVSRSKRRTSVRGG